MELMIISLLIIIGVTLVMYFDYKRNIASKSVSVKETEVSIKKEENLEEASKKREEHRMALTQELYEAVCNAAFREDYNEYNVDRAIRIVSKIFNTMYPTNRLANSYVSYPDKGYCITHQVRATLPKLFDEVNVVAKNVKDVTNILYSIGINSSYRTEYGMLLERTKSYPIHHLDIPDRMMKVLRANNVPMDNGEIEISKYYLVFNTDPDTGVATTAIKESILTSITNTYQITFRTHPEDAIYNVVRSGHNTSIVLDNRMSRLLNMNNNSFITDEQILNAMYPRIRIVNGSDETVHDYSSAISELVKKVNKRITVLFSGKPGVGKSYLSMLLLKSFLDLKNDRYGKVLLETNIEYLVKDIQQPDIRVFKDSIILCDDVSLVNIKGNRLSVLKSLFNGPLNVTTNTTFIVTTNDPLSTIPESIKRAGRTVQVLIDPLTQEDIKNLSEVLNETNRAIDKDFLERMKNKDFITVAEIFNNITSNVVWKVDNKVEENDKLEDVVDESKEVIGKIRVEKEIDEINKLADVIDETTEVKGKEQIKKEIDEINDKLSSIDLSNIDE